MSVFHHFLITRFSYRGKHVLDSIDGPTFLLDADPLEPRRLARRFGIFEFTCLPSVLGQSSQDFTWILLVDKDLPPESYRRLASLVSVRPGTIIVPYDPGMNLAQLDWLKGAAPDAPYAITTNFDDDDCIPRYFVERFQQHVVGLLNSSALPPISILGVTAALEWDLLRSRLAPLGWRAPWHRGRWVVSVGLSLCCKVPEFNLCVIGLRHRLADRYLDFSKPPVNANAAWFQQSVRAAAQSSGLALERWPPANLFHDLSETCGPALLSNHETNDQATRLHEPKALRVPVAGPESLAEFPIDWARARDFFAA
jgi:hypothetical protein